MSAEESRGVLPEGAGGPNPAWPVNGGGPHPAWVEAPSPKSYARAVVLSSVLGWLGAQHFYLGRWAEGLLDVGLTCGWVYAFALDEPLWGCLFLVADGGHALFSTILLLVGGYRDGDGLRVCYPGQRLRPTRIG